MNQDDHDKQRNNVPRGTSRTVDSIPDKGRRSFLQIAMSHGIAAPIALATVGCANAATLGGASSAGEQADTSKTNRSGVIIRDFADPFLELLRLLREGAEIEHAVMLEYLYCAFSIKDKYQSLIGFGNATSDNILGVAVQEMQHLGAVNKLLTALGSCPHLEKQDFPYEPDIYPFPFKLEPLSRSALAKYAFLEGPASIFAENDQHSPEDQQFRRQVLSDLGGLNRPNHVGSLYRNILELLSEAAAQPDFPLSPAEVEEWRTGLMGIMEEGEHDHFEFFRQVYDGSHPAFAKAGVPNVWDLPLDHEDYPAHQIAENPTAFIGHPNQIASQDGQAIAWLSNLHYWISLCCLDYSYRYDDQNAWDLSVSQMMTGLWPLAAELPRYGVGAPFDTLSMGYAPGTGKEESRRFILALAREAQTFAGTIEGILPARYDRNSADTAIEQLGTVRAK